MMKPEWRIQSEKSKKKDPDYNFYNGILKLFHTMILSCEQEMRGLKTKF